MVRVLSVYHFTDQSVHKIEDAIDSCLIGSNKLAVATPNLDVEIWELRSTTESSTSFGSGNSYIFPTVDEVEQIIYCPNGNYLATVESKLDNKNRVRKYVRVYTNWDSIEQNPDHMINFRARIAGKVTPSDKYLSSNDLEMIELPLKLVPTRIACCQATGNMALSCDNRVIFYEFRLVKSETGRHEYIDFIEIPFHVELTFHPTSIAFCEGIVCCMDHQFLNLFKIQKVGEPRSISLSVDSFSSEICSNQINTKDTLDFRTIAHQKMLNKELFRVEMVSDMEDFGNCDIKPEVVTEMLIVLRGHGESELMNKYSIKSLLQLKMRSKFRSFCDSFSCLALKPIYRVTEDNAVETENLFQSRYSKGVISVALCVATQQDAYLYSFHNNDEWRHQPELLASYSFTSPVIDLVLDDTVLHALTETGVETYTLRIGQKIFYSSCEFFMSSNQEEIIRPNLDDPVCLVGIRPFIGMKRIFSSGSHVILLANEASNMNEPTWTIYNLRKPRTETLYKNIEEFAMRFRADNPKMFLSLMHEAHVIVRLMVETVRVIPADEMNRQNLKAVPLLTFSSTIEPVIETIFVDSCRALADYFVVQPLEEEYYMALPYYMMGRLNVNEIFNRLIQFEQNGGFSMRGVVYTLKRLFLRIQPESDGQSSRSSSSTLEFNDNSAMEMMNYRLEKGNIMKILFDLLLKYSPSDITSIALQSQIFASRMGDRIYEFLEKRCERIFRTQEESLCLALQLIRMRNANEARLLVEQFDDRILMNILIKHWPILFETSLNHSSGNSVVVFSEFTELCLLCSRNLSIQIVSANVLKYLLVNLQVLPFDVLLKLLMDYTALQIGCEGDGIGRKILLMTLELYLIEYHNQKKTKSLESSIVSPMIENNSDVSIKTASSKNNNSFMSEIDSGLSIFGPIATSKALKILIRSYLGQLKSFTLNYQPKAEQPKSPILEPNSRPEFEKLEKDIDVLFDQHKKLNDSQSESLRKLCGEDLNLNSSEISLLRPILFLSARLNYLNVMPPLESNFLDILLKPKEKFLKTTNQQIREANLSCVKIQAILCSSEVPPDLINEISQFVYANPNLIGIESIISCLLPTRECIEFLTNVCPQAVLEFAKDRIQSDEDWKFLIKCLQQRTDKDATESNGGLLLFFHRLLKETLEYIANVRPLEAVLKIFPDDEINKIKLNNDPDLKDSHYLNEAELSQNPFIENLRRCVEKERAQKIKMVITARNQRKDQSLIVKN